MTTAVVLLYGVFRNDHPHYASYKKYLDDVSRLLLREKISTVILCGGHTNPKHRKESESSTAKRYLETEHGWRGLILEDRSINTNQNLAFAAENIRAGENFLICCDEGRKAKVIWMALHYLLGKDPAEIFAIVQAFAEKKTFSAEFSYKNLRVHGFWYAPKRDQLLAQTYSSIFDVTALYSHLMKDLNLAERRRNFGIPTE